MICLMAMSCLMVQAQDFDAFFSKWKDKAGIEYQEITNIRDSLMRQMNKIQRVFSAAQKKVLSMHSLWLASKTSQVRWESEA